MKYSLLKCNVGRNCLIGIIVSGVLKVNQKEEWSTLRGTIEEVFYIKNDYKYKFIIGAEFQFRSSEIIKESDDLEILREEIYMEIL